MFTLLLYILINKQYPLCQWTKEDTIEKVFNEVVSQWKVQKESITSNPKFLEQLYDKGKK
jgi:hypothetical protein